MLTLYYHLWPVCIFHIFPTLSHKRHDIREIFIEHKMCILILQKIFTEVFLILKRTE